MVVRRPALWSLLLILLLTSACFWSSDSDKPAAKSTAEATATGPKRGGTLTMSMGDDFVTFHPFFDVANSEFKPQFFEAPIRIGDKGDFEPWLAESWEQAADGLSITLHLRSGVKFHNGREMTADDLIWSLSHARDASYGHQLAPRFATVTGAQKLDDLTVRISYSERTPSQLDALARLYIFPQEALDSIATTPVGTGPFKFVEWIPGDSLTIERFDDYWRKGFPYLDKVVVKPIPDPAMRVTTLQSSAIDLLMNVPLADKATLSTADSQKEGIVVGAEPPGFSFFAFIININSPPFDNQLVRQAFNYAIDRQGIVDHAFYGQAISMTVPYPTTSWAYNDDLKDHYTYNPQKAKELLAAAGYPDGFSIKMLVRGTDGPHLAQAQVYQQQLAAVGIYAQLFPTAEDDYWPLLYASNFSIVSHSTSNQSVDPGGLFEAAACCRPFNSFFGLEYTQEELQKPPDQRADRTDAWFVEYRDTINQARQESDRQVRQGLYHRAMEILLDQGWMIPTVWNQSTYAHWNYVHNLRMDPDGNIWLGETWLDH